MTALSDDALDALTMSDVNAYASAYYDCLRAETGTLPGADGELRAAIRAHYDATRAKLEARITQLVALARRGAELRDRVALLDRVIGSHHNASVMREEHDVCPVCMERGGVEFFSETSRLIRAPERPEAAALDPSRSIPRS